MDIPARTAEYFARRESRQNTLRTLLVSALPKDSGTPITLEVGCGHGHYLTAYAAAHPHRCCIGIDIASDRIRRADRKRERARLPNLHFIRADVWDVFESLSADVSLSEIFILFPDPWPKRRHHKNRVMQTEFLTRLAKRTGKGGRLYFRTDHQPYFGEAQSAVASHPNWQFVPPASWPLELTTVFQARAKSFDSFIAELHPSDAAPPQNQ